MTAVLKLAGILDLNAAAPLKADLAARAGAPLDLDASAVERVGALPLQVLIAAANTWRSLGHNFSVKFATQAFLDDMRLMNASHLIATEAGSQP
jgi:chemotaxis protein CheX